MKRTKKQFTVDRIVPESEGKLHIKVGIHLLLSLCLCLGSLSVLHAEGNEYPSIGNGIFADDRHTGLLCVVTEKERKTVDEGILLWRTMASGTDPDRFSRILDRCQKLD